MKIANRDARDFGESKEEFKANNLFAEFNHKGHYVVYSYGYHFPMFVFHKELGWIENDDKYSVSTSKQQTQARPDVKIAIYMTTELIKYSIK